MNDHELLLARYEEIAGSGDHQATACDYQLRELEIDFASSWIPQGSTVLDVGCGMGYALSRYSRITKGQLLGLDYSPKMVESARELAPELFGPDHERVWFVQGSVEEMPFEDSSVDVVTSHRCLMALLSWERQAAALEEIARVLKPGGHLILMEGTFEGLDRLNALRVAVGLDPIPDDGKDRLLTLKFNEGQLLEHCAPLFELREQRGFGSYYFLGRVVQPLLVAPAAPSYDHPLNAVAKSIERALPNLVDCGHLQAFALEKRG